MFLAPSFFSFRWKKNKNEHMAKMRKKIRKTKYFLVKGIKSTLLLFSLASLIFSFSW